jgi:hypothetical protein
MAETRGEHYGMPDVTKRNKLSDKERNSAKEVRARGACLRCSVYKLRVRDKRYRRCEVKANLMQCSEGRPCDSCQTYFNSLWDQDD